MSLSIVLRLARRLVVNLVVKIGSEGGHTKAFMTLFDKVLLAQWFRPKGLKAFMCWGFDPLRGLMACELSLSAGFARARSAANNLHRCEDCAPTGLLGGKTDA